MAAAVIISRSKEIRKQGMTLLLSVVTLGIATIFFGLSCTFFGAMTALIFIIASDFVSAIIRNTIR